MSQRSSLPPAARTFSIVVIFAGVAAVAAWLVDVPAWRGDDWLTFAVVAVATAAAERFPLEIHYRNERAVYSLSDAVWTGTLLIAPASVLVLSLGVGVLAGQALLRRPPLKLAFNVSQFLVGMTAAVLVFDALGSPTADDPAAWPAAALAMAIFQALNTILVGVVISLAENRPFRQVALPGTGVLHWAGNVAIGILGALVWVAQPLALPLLLVPLALTFLAYREWARTTQERDWMARMGHAADAIAGSGDLARRITEPGGDDAVGRLATTLNRMLSRLEEAFLRERKFIRETSHELRTPLTICRGYLEVLDPDAPPQEVEGTKAVVIDEIGRMTRIVEDMNRLAYLEDPSGLKRSDVDLGPFMTGVAARAFQLLDGRLEVVPPPRSAILHADEQRIAQALMNLLKNAADHAPASAPIRLRACPEPGAWRFEVSDEGGGVSEGLEPQIFDPYVRGEASRGSGLGLAIVASIARSHGGAAGVSNRPGQGVTFWVRVPR